MTTQEDHEILTKVGPGTLLGDLFRQYQIPVLLSTELEQGGPPKRVRLLGEDLVAFRSKGGNQVGHVGEFCSHRRASLYFGRIEEEGISVGNQQKWDTFVKERSGGNGSVVGLPEQVVVAFAAG